MIKVYIAGPYTTRTQDGKKHNADRAALVGAELIQRGFQPFVPHLSHYIDILSPHPLDYETWMEQDFGWLAVCDCLFRLPGKSSGADREEKFAAEHGIPVFTAYEQVEAFRDLKLYGPHETSEEVDYLWQTDYKARCERIIGGDTREVVTPERYFKAEAERRERERTLADEDECDACGCCNDCNPGLKPLTETQECQIASLIQRFGSMFARGFEITVNDDGSVGMRGAARL